MADPMGSPRVDGVRDWCYAIPSKMRQMPFRAVPCCCRSHPGIPPCSLLSRCLLLLPSLRFLYRWLQWPRWWWRCRRMAVVRSLQPHRVVVLRSRRRCCCWLVVRSVMALCGCRGGAASLKTRRSDAPRGVALWSGLARWGSTPCGLSPWIRGRERRSLGGRWRPLSRWCAVPPSW